MTAGERRVRRNTAPRRSKRASANASAANAGAAAVYEYRDALSLPAADGGLSPDSPCSVFIEPPGKLRKFKSSLPLFLDDPDGVNLFPSFARETIHYPPAFVAAARNARIVGFRSVLSENGLFFNDDSTLSPEARRAFLSDFILPDPRNEETGLRPAGAAERFYLDPGRRQTVHLDGATVFLGSAEPSNYGSFLFRTLPKLHTLAQIDLEPSTRYLIWAGIPAFREYLQLLGIAEERIVHHDLEFFIYDLDRAIVPSVRNRGAFLDAESRRLFARLRKKYGGPQRPGKKIYVSRKLISQSASSRVMVNEAELLARIASLGFDIVTPETLSVPEQILAFSSAEMVVGPSGSGMFNVVYCHPGTKVIDIESEPHWMVAHQSLFSSCKLRYGVFVGDAADREYRKHHQPWTLNVKALLSRIESFSRLP